MKWSFYHRETGLFSKRTISSRLRIDAARNAPADHAEIAGEFDCLSQRVDIATGEVIDYQPSQPSPDHEWVDRRWVLNQAAQLAVNLDKQARAQLAQLDLQSQRYVAESVAGIIDDIGRQRLADILARKAELRRNIRHG